MGSICNGLALSKLRPFGSGFLIFSDYMKPPIRLSAIMELPVIYAFTHDLDRGRRGWPDASAGRAAGRAAQHPGLIVLRPADANEVAEAWRVALRAQARAGLPDPEPAEPADSRPHALRAGELECGSGAYVLADAGSGKPDVILMATGSEVDSASTSMRD